MRELPCHFKSKIQHVFAACAYLPLHVSMCNAYLQVCVCWSQLGQIYILELFTVFVDVYNNAAFICNSIVLLHCLNP